MLVLFLLLLLLLLFVCNTVLNSAEKHCSNLFCLVHRQPSPRRVRKWLTPHSSLSVVVVVVHKTLLGNQRNSSKKCLRA